MYVCMYTASHDPIEDREYCQLLLAKDTQALEVQKLMLQLELAKLQTSMASAVLDNRHNPRPDKIFGCPFRPTADALPTTMAAHLRSR